MCASVVWMYLRTPAVVEPLSSVHDTTVPYAVPPATVCVIFSSTAKSAVAPVILSDFRPDNVSAVEKVVVPQLNGSQ